MIIIHGDDVTASRKKLDELLLNRTNIKRVDGKTLSADNLVVLFDSTELFAVKKVVVIENCKALPKKTQETLFSLKIDPDTELILWQGGVLDSRFIKKFTEPTLFSFLLPKYFFTFMDNLMPKKGAHVHTLYEKMLSSFAPEQILFSMVKRMRHLMMIQNGGGRDFEEIAKMKPFQVQKLSAQARQWEGKKLKAFYQKLYSLELGMKTGSLPSDLEKHIDILLLSEL